MCVCVRARARVVVCVCVCVCQHNDSSHAQNCKVQKYILLHRLQNHEFVVRWAGLCTVIHSFQTGIMCVPMCVLGEDHNRGHLPIKVLDANAKGWKRG